MRIHRTLWTFLLVLALAAGAQAASIDIIEEYSAEHNVVMQCNLDIQNATRYIWSVDGTQVFESHKDDYGPALETFPNYLHTFPGNGTYFVECSGQDASGTRDSASRTLAIETRATSEEIAEQMTVVRLNAEYLGDYKVQYTCDVIGVPSPGAWFDREGGYSSQNESMNLRLHDVPRNFDDYDNSDPDTFTVSETLPDKGNFEVECKAGTSLEQAWKPHQNNGALKAFSCFGGARGGSPECNTGSGFASFAIPQEDIASGIAITPINETHYQLVCEIPGHDGVHVRIDGLGFEGGDRFPGEGNPVKFTTQQEVVTPICFHDRSGTTESFGGTIRFEETISLQDEDSRTSDPGSSSTLTLRSGTLNDQDISPSQQSITVHPGERIAGSVIVDYVSAWQSGISVPLITTPSWGDHEASFTSHGDATGTGSRTIALDVIAPETAGTHHLIFVYRAEVDSADVASMTNWAANPEVWDDGNDIASWSHEMINEANTNGRAQGQALFTDGLRPVHVPATAIEIVVQDGGAPACGNGILEEGEQCDDGNTLSGDGCSESCFVEEDDACHAQVASIPAECTGGEITQDTLSGTCRTIVCSGLQVLACEKPDTGTKTHFEMYKQSSASGIEICLAGTCIAQNGYAQSPSYPICTGTPPSCTDTDGDGFAIEGGTCGQIDCNDNNAAINPAATETCNEIDDNCNGQIDDIPDDADACGGGGDDPTCTDTDGDGFSREGGECGPIDCNDANAAINPGAAEVCNGIDDNCSGDSDADIDEGGVCDATCYSGVNEIPAECTGGTFTVDEKGGCRTLVCAGDSGSIQVLACNKPDGQAPEYFEMYNQFSSGTPPEICLAGTCLSTGGFASSDDLCEEGAPSCTDADGDGFAIEGGTCGQIDCNDNNAAINPAATETCNEIDDNCNGQIDDIPDDADACGEAPVCGNGILEEGEQCDDGNTLSGDGCSESCFVEEDDACHAQVASIPAECSGGTISQDTLSGTCRTIVCSGLQVLACDKPDTGTKTHFEMYKQSSADGIEICLAGTCIAGNGYAKSGIYPICVS